MTGKRALSDASGCFVCSKHRDPALMPGGPVAFDELTVVSHVSPLAPGNQGQSVYLGHLVVEPRRHAPGLADLTEAEAASIGVWCSRTSRALRDETTAEHIYAAAIGHAIPHLHVHIFARYPGTPREFWWDRVSEWPGAPRGGQGEIADLVSALRNHLLRLPG